MQGPESYNIQDCLGCRQLIAYSEIALAVVLRIVFEMWMFANQPPEMIRKGSTKFQASLMYLSKGIRGVLSRYRVLEGMT